MAPDSEGLPLDQDQQFALEHERVEMKKTYDRYARHLGFAEHKVQLENAHILDTGSGREAYFGDYVVNNFSNSTVVSIDDDSHFVNPLMPVDGKRHVKIPNCKIENLNLRGQHGWESEPEFDYVFSEASFPYTLLSEAPLDPAPREGLRMPTHYSDWAKDLPQKMLAGLRQSLGHLKVHGTYICFPVFGFGRGSHGHQSDKLVVDLGSGGKFDFSGWSAVLHEKVNAILGSGIENKKFKMLPPEEVEWHVNGDARPIKAQRLSIQRTA